jgi:hypothetical protein
MVEEACKFAAEVMVMGSELKLPVEKGVLSIVACWHRSYTLKRSKQINFTT